MPNTIALGSPNPTAKKVATMMSRRHALQAVKKARRGMRVWRLSFALCNARFHQEWPVLRVLAYIFTRICLLLWKKQKGRFRKINKIGTALGERDPKKINVASLSMAFEASLESRYFPRCRYPLIKVERIRRKDARASQEAYLMSPETSVYMM